MALGFEKSLFGYILPRFVIDNVRKSCYRIFAVLFLCSSAPENIFESCKLFTLSTLYLVDPKDFASCNLARVSSHAVLARVDAPIASYQSLLKDIDTKLQEKTGSSLKYDGKLFSKNTIGLEVVAQASQSYDKYLDQKYINDISALDHCGECALDRCQVEHKIQ